jgi:hypothetical protein
MGSLSLFAAAVLCAAAANITRSRREARVENSHRHPTARSTGTESIARVLADRQFVLGDGSVTVEPVPNLIRLPCGHEEWAIDYHAVARDSLGRIYVLYNSARRFNYTRALARFYYAYDREADAGCFVFDTFLGTRELADGTVHGMNIFFAHDGKGGIGGNERILIVNQDRTISLLDLDGRQIWCKRHDGRAPDQPTTGVGLKSKPVIGVVDGYATSLNFLFDAADGTIVGCTGRKGSGDGELNQNHGVDVDRNGDLVVCDRKNTRLTWWRGEDFQPQYVGRAQKKLDMPGLEVCNASFLGNFAVVPCLNSTLAFLGPDADHSSGYKVISLARMPQELIDAGLDGIHDAELTADGRYVIVAVWERHPERRQLPTLTAFRINWGEHSGTFESGRMEST